MKKAIVMLAVAALVAPAALADWDPGDSHKMHYPQLPDPNGWDVEISSWQHEIADDWKCSASGPVSDLHFWYSTVKDLPNEMDWVTVTIYSDDRSGPYSKPGEALWTRTFDQALGDFSIRYDVGTGQQGFFDPQEPWWGHPDHQLYHQVNIENIVEPFVQTEDTTYWLGIYAYWEPWPQASVGWKTTQDYFQDGAVFDSDLLSGPENHNWLPLLDPQVGGDGVLELAFVVTPEPATLSLLALGGAALLKRRRSA